MKITSDVYYAIVISSIFTHSSDHEGPIKAETWLTFHGDKLKKEVSSIDEALSEIMTVMIDIQKTSHENL